MRRTAVLLLLPAAVLVGCGEEGPTSPELEASAEQACQGWVRDQMEAPSTAEFADVHTFNAQADFTAEDVSEGRLDATIWTVQGAVDAPDSSGGVFRESFVCETRPAGGSWTLVDLSLG